MPLTGRELTKGFEPSEQENRRQKLLRPKKNSTRQPMFFAQKTQGLLGITPVYLSNTNCHKISIKPNKISLKITEDLTHVVRSKYCILFLLPFVQNKVH